MLLSNLTSGTHQWLPPRPPTEGPPRETAAPKETILFPKSISPACYSSIFFCLILLCGAILRLLTCYWGYPYQLHPDEGTIVNCTIDMLRRHSYEPAVYNRPDHFEIKCCAILFQVVSYLKYHVDAVTAFPEHRMAFYLIARAFTAFWGVLTIILAYKIVEKISSQAKLLAAALVAFFPIFVQNSALAIPDITLTFFVLLITYESILYLENPSRMHLVLICVTTGIGITCKYTCAIACIWIGVVICINDVKKGKYLEIFKDGILSVVLVLATCFFCAPNLFTNIFETIKVLQLEARSTHLGADGLGFFGNFAFYLSTFLHAAGYSAGIGMVAGVFVCLKKRNLATLSLGLGMVFWICTSILPLHWERWGMPIYIFFVIITALGINYLFNLSGSTLFKYITSFFGFIILLNSLLSSLLIAQSSLTVDARVAAIDFCKKRGITKENSLCDGYTPFFLGTPATIKIDTDKDGKLSIPEGIKYLIISSAMYKRYYDEPRRYTSQVRKYDSIQKNYELIYNEGGPYYKHSNFAIINIIYAINGLLSRTKDTITGCVIKIYLVNSTLGK